MAPTRIAYKASALRFSGVLFAILTLLFTVVLLSVPHVARVSCERAAGTCTITRHAVFAPWDRETLPIADLSGAGSARHTSGKGVHATVWFETKSGQQRPLDRGLLRSRFDVDDATSGVADLDSFLASPDAKSIEVVFWSGHIVSVLSFILGLVVARLAYGILRELAAQYFPIVVTVDHEARLLRLPGRVAVRFDDIDEIVIDRGQALRATSGKNEHIPGYRIVVRTKNRVVIPLTKDHRVGPEQLHDKARRDILEAIAKKA